MDGLDDADEDDLDELDFADDTVDDEIESCTECGFDFPRDELADGLCDECIDVS